MFLHCKTENLMVVDFQLIYLTDSKLNLDFYAGGLVKEPYCLFEIPSPYRRIDYGFVVGKYNDVKQYHLFFKQKLKEPQTVDIISKKMIQSIKKVENESVQIEKNIKLGKFDLENFINYYEMITEMMAYRNFVELCEPEIFADDKEEYYRQIKKISIPSYLLELYNALKKVTDINNEEEIESFIWNYGYLSNFNIAASEFEIKENVIDYITNKINNELKEIEIKNYNEEVFINKKNSFSLKLFYRIGWAEEKRHIFQLRALRNFRILFEYMNLDIHNATIEDIINRV